MTRLAVLSEPEENELLTDLAELIYRTIWHAQRYISRMTPVAGVALLVLASFDDEDARKEHTKRQEMVAYSVRNDHFVPPPVVPAVPPQDPDDWIMLDL